MELAPGIAVAELIPERWIRPCRPICAGPTGAVLRWRSSSAITAPTSSPVALAARFCLWVLTQTSQKQLTDGSPWYIYDQRTQGQWLAPGTEFPYPEP